MSEKLFKLFLMNSATEELKNLLAAGKISEAARECILEELRGRND